MTKAEFEKYKFSINTKVKFRGKWSGINEVWFHERRIQVIGTGRFIHFSEIEDIKE